MADQSSARERRKIQAKYAASTRRAKLSPMTIIQM
jgi:hypothetical protein